MMPSEVSNKLDMGPAMLGTVQSRGQRMCAAGSARSARARRHLADASRRHCSPEFGQLRL